MPRTPLILPDFNYTFDDNNNITHQEFAHRASTPDNQYTYDDLDRLTEADYLVGLLTEDEQFDYDKLGNRETVTLRDESVETYAVNYLTNRYDNDQGEDIVCTYDDAGNTTVDPNGYQYSYDYENRIIEIKDKDSVSIVEYTYDALGRRIQKEDKIAGETTRYYYNNNWQVLTETDEEGYELRSFIYGNYIDEVLVMIDPNVSEDYYYAHDHLFSPAALMEDDGDVVERYEYDAYGKPTIWDSTFSSERESSSYNNPYMFTGRRVDILDDDNYKVQYSRNRYYDYYTGRWITHDPYGVNIKGQISGFMDGLNLYLYVQNKPVSRFDPSGLKMVLPWENVKIEDCDAVRLSSFNIGKDISILPPYLSLSIFANASVGYAECSHCCKFGVNGWVKDSVFNVEGSLSATFTAGTINWQTDVFRFFAGIRGSLSGTASGGISIYTNHCKENGWIGKGCITGTLQGRIEAGFEASVNG